MINRHCCSMSKPSWSHLKKLKTRSYPCRRHVNSLSLKVAGSTHYVIICRWHDCATMKAIQVISRCLIPSAACSMRKPASRNFKARYSVHSSISTWYSAVGGQPRPTGCLRKLCLLKIDENFRLPVTSSDLKKLIFTQSNACLVHGSGGATLLTNMARFICFQRLGFWIM